MLLIMMIDAFDPLSANRRFPGAADLAVLGTLVFAGPTCHSISVMVPDCLLPPVDNMVRIDLRHHVGLSLGPAVDMTRWSPEAQLDRALCPALFWTHWSSNVEISGPS